MQDPGILSDLMIDSGGLRAAFDALPHATAVLDDQGVIVAVNAAWRHFAEENDGRTHVAGHGCGLGVNYLAVCDAAGGADAEDGACVAAGLRQLLAGTPLRVELEYPCHSPQVQRWFMVSAHLLVPPARGVVVTHVEITRRKLEEIERKATELRLQLALEATGDGLWDWDLSSGKAYLSPEYYALTGYRPEDVVADFAFFRRLVHADDWAHVTATIEAHARGETLASVVEYRMVTANGDERWIRGRGCVVERDATGSPLRMVGHISDITAQRATESALQVSEARYRGVVEDQTECICRLTSTGVILYVNPAYCRFFGRSADELTGNRWQPVAHPDDVAMIEARLTEMTPGNPVINIENRVFAADGSLRWMHFVNRGFYDASGCLIEIQSVGRDVTKRVMAEEKQRLLLVENTRLGRELIRLQEAERARLARELHDDLSQQLVAIRAYAGAIRRNPADAQRSVSNAAAIEVAVTDIYAASHRIMEGLHPQVLDSAGLLAAISLLLTRWSIAQPDVRAWMRTAGNVEPADEARRINLFRIVQECLANVLAHSGATRVRVFLGERAGPAGRRLRLVVRDDGRGMDPAVPYTGYGLIVMRERVRALGGRVELQAKSGSGLRVVLDIPLDGALED